MGCIFSSKEKSIYLNNKNNYSSSQRENTLIVECYDNQNNFLSSKSLRNLESVRLTKNCSVLEIYDHKNDEKIKHQSFIGPFSNGQFLTVDCLQDKLVSQNHDYLVLPRIFHDHKSLDNE